MAREMQRFSRQMKIKWFNQHKIRSTNCIIVGCGGIGCWTAVQLTMLGVRKLTLVDMDRVEEHNLNRQFFYEDEIHKYKAEVLRDKLKKINSHIIIEIENMPIERVNEHIYDNIQYIFDCLDNIPTREYLAKTCQEKRIIFIHSACSDVIGEVQLIVPGKTAEMRAYPESMKTKELKKKCTDFDPAICTTNMITASLQVDKFLDHLIRGDISKPTTNYIRGYGITYGSGE